MKRITYNDIDRNDLEFLLLEKKYSKVVVAKMMDCSVDMISRCSFKYGIKTLTTSEILKEQFNRGRSVNCKIYDIATKEDIEYLYIERGYSMNRVSKIFYTSIPTLKKWMRSYDIIWRDISKSLKNGYERDVITFSKGEKDLLEYIRNIVDCNIIENYRDLGFELDIFIPDLKIAIEFNGLYWHSERVVDINYHKNKSDRCRDNGIKLIHVWEDDWKFKNQRIKDWLNVLLNPNKKYKIYGRNCVVNYISQEKAKAIIDVYHIQGYCQSSICIGLFYKDNLIGCCTFIKKDDTSYYLNRYVIEPDYNVIGGFSKIIKHFIKHYNGDLYTFADLSWVDKYNNVYLSNNFYPDKELKPDYSYIFDKRRKHKFSFRHEHLKKILGEKYNPDKTEHENCSNNGIYRIYDCGKIRYKYNKKD